MKIYLAFLFILLYADFSFARRLPDRPAQPEHPSSSSYPFEVFKESITINGRTVDFFAPAGVRQLKAKAPVIIYGHGQATPLVGYQDTFIHLARKGVAVIFPQYDSGFFDQDWRRMGVDYVRLAKAAVTRYANYVDPQQVIYSGHSKGAYVALMAAGVTGQAMTLPPASLILFAPAGYDAQWIRNINRDIPATVIFSDKDTIIKESLINDIYNQLPNNNKQYIKAVSYPSLEADHFFVLNKKFFFGGRDGVSALHYYAAWKWLLGAAWDLTDTRPLTNPYLYGNETLTTGVQGLQHQLRRSW